MRGKDTQKDYADLVSLASIWNPSDIQFHSIISISTHLFCYVSMLWNIWVDS